MTKLTDLAAKIATEAHKGQTRWDKITPYIAHPAAVVRALIDEGHGEEEVVVGWLHDVLEDTDVTAQDLLDRGIPEHYILAVKDDLYAREVKIADIKHNLSDLKAGSMKQKYELALYILEADNLD